MNYWDKYKNKIFKEDLKKVNVAEAIAYANLLIAKISWKAIHNKANKRLFNNFFNVASLILHATIVQHEYPVDHYDNILAHIDDIYDKVGRLNYSKAEIGLMIGNLSEYTDVHYTFTELIAFVRFLAS